jgi:hypothetical protein
MTISDEQIEQLKRDLLFKPLNSAQELRDWMTLYLDITFPMGVVHPESTHGPIDAMWEIYKLMKTGESSDCPEIVMLSSRDSYKTLSAAAIEVLCLLHFQFSIAHAAAILSQSEKAVQYNDIFFRKVKPYLEYYGWKKISDSKRKIEWLLPSGLTIYLCVLTMTTKGMNSEHLPMLFLDEIDLVQDPRALEEAKMIPSIWKQYFPLTVALSTRKYKGGLMEKKIKEVSKSGGKILRWNILDVTARISHEEAQINKPKVIRYISRQLPLSNLSPEEFKELPEERQLEYEKFEAYAGIAEHPLLPVMKNMLVDRSQDDVGDLYKPVISVRNNFKAVTPDMGEAQLLCNKPSSSGLVYSRFCSTKNVLSPKDAIEKLIGESSLEYNNYFTALIQLLKEYGVKFIGGADWGFSDYTALVVLALLPNGEVWLVDSFSQQFLELDDIVKYMLEFDSEYNMDEWYPEQAYPAYLKTMKKRGLNVKKFKKVVEDGITAVQGKIVNSSNVRKFYIIDTPNNQEMIEAFGEHRWALDGKGEIIEGKEYHDKDGIKDRMDAIRYPFQNLFTKGGKSPYMTMIGNKDSNQKPINRNDNLLEASKKINNGIIQSYIKDLATKESSNTRNEEKKNKKRIFWI